MTAPPWSLARRLAWRLAGVLVGAIGLAAIAVGWRAIVIARALDDTALQAQVRAVAAHLAAAPDGTPLLNLPPALAAAFQVGAAAREGSQERSQDRTREATRDASGEGAGAEAGAATAAGAGGNLYLVAGPQDQVLLASDPAAAALVAPYLPPGDGLFRVPSAPAQPRGMVGFVARAGRFRVAVAQSREQSEVLVRSLLGEFLSTSLLLLGAIGGAAVLIGVWTVSDGLRPLRRASAAAARVDPAQPGLRLPDADLPGEVAPLVAAVNQALARMEAALAAQRRFVGDAAHTLRTPLAVLTARLDTLSAAAPPDRHAVDALRRDADRMARLIEQMLLMARLDGQPLDVTRPVVLRAVAVEAISALAPLALRRGLELALRETGTPGPVSGNHAMLVIALTNLLDNALAHAPPCSLVEVELAAPSRLTVLDRGPGVPPAERAAVFERFHSGLPGAVPAAGAALGEAPGASAAAPRTRPAGPEPAGARPAGAGPAGPGAAGAGPAGPGAAGPGAAGPGPAGAGAAGAGAAAAERRAPQGAGLGLAIVAGIAAAHRGAAWVADREGGGAAFVLALGTAGVASPDAPDRPGQPPDRGQP